MTGERKQFDDSLPSELPFRGNPGQHDGDVLAHNQRAWNRLVAAGDRLTQPAGDEEFNDPLKVVDGCGWLGGDIRGKRVLCLAAGGGRQGPLYAAAGAQVTVVDLSDQMLALDREVAAERGLQLRTIMTSMDDLHMLSAGSFDIVIHPVSTCYVPDVRPVYRAVAEILRGGGLYISQHKQPTSLQVMQQPVDGKWVLENSYYQQTALPPAKPGSLVREQGTNEFIHRWEELIGSMCQAGFAIEDLREPCHAKTDFSHGSFAHHSMYAPPYVRIKARRLCARSPIWLG